MTCIKNGEIRLHVNNILCTPIQNTKTVSTYVFYAFLNRTSDCDEIWYRDRLDFGGKESCTFCREKGK